MAKKNAKKNDRGKKTPQSFSPKRKKSRPDQSPDLTSSSQLVVKKIPKKIPALDQHVEVEIVPDLPLGYGDNLICLMVRDPEWIYTYWEIQDARQKWGLGELDSSFHEVDSVLRVYDLSENENYEVYFDIKIEGTANSWFIRVSPNHLYCVEIGFKRHRDGRFVALSKSNVSSTPPNEISDVIDENWMGLDFVKMYALSGGLASNASSVEISQFFKDKLLHQLSSDSGSKSLSSSSGKGR